mmetsp:Transcript_9085/g.27317  ORF Transcript_9085/g.27317 Transcript_9085/m.27317 type:complete len:208 (-) Transcript_9085:143-766(-)
MCIANNAIQYYSSLNGLLFSLNQILVSWTILQATFKCFNRGVVFLALYFGCSFAPVALGPLRFKLNAHVGVKLCFLIFLKFCIRCCPIAKQHGICRIEFYRGGIQSNCFVVTSRCKCVITPPFEIISIFLIHPADSTDCKSSSVRSSLSRTTHEFILGAFSRRGSPQVPPVPPESALPFPNVLWGTFLRQRSSSSSTPPPPPFGTKH